MADRGDDAHFQAACGGVALDVPQLLRRFEDDEVHELQGRSPGWAELNG